MRTKKTIINFLTDSLPQIIIMILGFFKIKLFLDFLGDEQLGLYQLYGQIVSYLVLIEGGVGSALLFRLYKPIANHDQQKINRLMSAGRFLFNIIGLIITVIGVALSFGVSFFIKDASFNNSFLQLTFILFLASQVINYFTIPYRTYFDAEQNRYVPNLIFQSTTIIKSILEIILVVVLPSSKFIWILCLGLLCGIISNIVLIFFFKHRYKRIKFCKEKDFSILKDVKHLFVNTLSNVVVNNIDIILISSFVGLSSVVIYSAYNYFVEAIRQLVDKITGATMSSVGNLISSDPQKSLNIFLEFNNFVSYIAIIICVPFWLFVDSFINIWYDNSILTSSVLSILFSVLLFYQIIRIPLKTFTLSGGFFKQVKWYTLVEIAINLTLSLVLLQFMGIAGVLLGTIISLVLAEYIPKPLILYKNIFNTSPKKYFLGNAQMLVITITIATILYYLKSLFTITTLIQCITLGILIFLITIALTTVLFKVSNRLTFIKRLKIFKILKGGRT